MVEIIYTTLCLAFAWALAKSSYDETKPCEEPLVATCYSIAMIVVLLVTAVNFYWAYIIVFIAGMPLGSLLFDWKKEKGRYLYLAGSLLFSALSVYAIL